jgi:diguanylate cyclase (GGDEF)-like protein
LVTVISRFRVRNGLEDEVRRAFLDRPRLVENAPGFCGISVMTEEADPAVFLLLTRWRDAHSFHAWHNSPAHHQSHGLMPKGLKLDASFTSLTIGNCVEDAASIQNLSDAIEGQTAGLSQWLSQSDTLVVLLLGPDGSIRARNQAGDRFFPPNPENKSGSSIWEYLQCFDAQPLRERLAGSQDWDNGSLLLNMLDAQNVAITLEVWLIGCGSTTLMLAAEERRRDARFQNEVLQLTNDLSVMVREAAQKNRELKQANETIERLARTDALTGLANRRTMHEALEREIARAGRQAEPLSAIMGDVDHFKSINDQYGHAAGDKVLATTAALFAAQSRPYDVAARYGGEEFVLLLPKTFTDGALIVAERIRNAIAEMNFAECPRPVTISLGVATWIAGEGPEEFIARADAALYAAKHGGRNRVESASAVRGLNQAEAAGQT